NKGLEQSILDLASRAGIEGSRVFEVNKSIDTKALNAYVTGVLGSKRIVRWILLSSFLTLTSLILVDRLGRWLVARYSHILRFESLADVASVPLLLLL